MKVGLQAASAISVASCQDGRVEPSGSELRRGGAQALQVGFDLCFDPADRRAAAQMTRIRAGRGKKGDRAREQWVPVLGLGR